MVAAAAGEQVKEITSVSGLKFTVASRPQSKYSAAQTVNNAAAGDFQPIILNATGFVRRISLIFNASIAFASGAALVAGDAPFNLISLITLTDAAGRAIVQPVSGYTLSRINKYFSCGGLDTSIPRVYGDPQVGSEFNYAVAGGTSGVATFRLDIDLEQDPVTGYGSIPNLDSNASLQLKVSYAAASAAFGGTTPSSQSLSVTVEQHYWATVSPTLAGRPVQQEPPGAGDYVETRYENKVVSGGSENLTDITSKGGMMRGLLLISRNAGARSDWQAATNFGIVLDNYDLDAGVKIETRLDKTRRTYGFIGAQLTTSYAPLSPLGILPGLDRGVVAVNFGAESGGRDSWLPVRPGQVFQLRHTPAAGATQLEIVALIGTAASLSTFYNAAE